MNRHEQAMTSLLNDIIGHDPVCSAIAVGSIGRGDYTAQSDMDLVVVTWRFDSLADHIGWQHSCTCSRTESVRFDEGTVLGILCHLSACSPTNYQGHVMTGPVWRWGPARILHDPSGIAKWGEACREQFYRDNENLDRRHAVFHEQYRRWKSDKSFKREFETEADFVMSLDKSGARVSYGSFVDQMRFSEIDLPVKMDPQG